MSTDILAPVVALALWTMIMWLWMYATRIPAMNRAGIDSKGLVGTTGRNLDDTLPPNVQWKAHNYNHLLTEPTIFYVIAITLALFGENSSLSLTLAWIYVALRVLHSIVQATINRVLVRFILFAASSITLMALIVRAAQFAF